MHLHTPPVLDCNISNVYVTPSCLNLDIHRKKKFAPGLFVIERFYKLVKFLRVTVHRLRQQMHN